MYSRISKKVEFYRQEREWIRLLVYALNPIEIKGVAAV